MGRELKRVPLDFDWPLEKIWKGYLPENAAGKMPVASCLECQKKYKQKISFLQDGTKVGGHECSEDKSYCIYNPDNKAIWYFDPPEGEGYQLWETTSEGSPISPVFKTLDELCEWAEENVTTFADSTTTKEKWKEMLEKGFVYHEEDGFLFM